MTAKTKAVLLVQAQAIRDERAGAANTATRVGQHLVDMLDSEQGDQSSTIAAGSITLSPGVSFLTADTEGAAAADDLDTIGGANLRPGHVVVVRSAANGRVPTVRSAVGNMELVGAVNFALANVNHRIALMWTGVRWMELWRVTF